MSFSNTATPIYYGQFRAAVLRGEIPVNKEKDINYSKNINTGVEMLNAYRVKNNWGKSSYNY